MPSAFSRITVKATGNDMRVVIWEKHPAHPKGEVLIANNGKEVEVAKTPAISQALGDGRLEEVKKPGRKPSSGGE